MVVTFTHDPTFALEGVYWRWRGGWVTLRNVTAVRPGQTPEAATGEVVIDHARIAYVQVLP